MIIFLRVLVEIVFVFLLWDGVVITYLDYEILSIHGVVFRYAFLCDIWYVILYCIGEYIIPYLYHKINFIFSKLDKHVRNSC